MRSSKRMQVDLDLGGHSAPPLAELRAHIREALATMSAECVEDVELLATELVSNAYDHGLHPISARLWSPPHTRFVRVEVDDSNALGLPVVGVSRLGAFRGRGLVMVDRLAHRWGTAVRTWGKTIWAEVPCALA
ncbi:ATP-binding protein [Umezawaea sp. Da 62-37]|uniref:ATP-binding protein n=1 Tax=Umezawaea sp. Da 62-37 TaxID=3075927 RepID=UPI0028F6DF61|nr:ATP-binding protein [Umezawaea sp. Da 62-37]WNV89048.1 ATP-binding protein [Umezawaea sp. Da 62-37]